MVGSGLSHLLESLPKELYIIGPTLLLYSISVYATIFEVVGDHEQ